MPNRILCNSKSIQSSSGCALYGRYLSKWVCLLQPARNNSQIHKLTKTLSHPSFTYITIWMTHHTVWTKGGGKRHLFGTHSSNTIFLRKPPTL